METAYVTDTRFAQHTLDGHPEHTGRLAAVHEQLAADGLIERMQVLESLPAEDDDLLAVHDARYLAQLKETSLGRARTMFDPDTYVLPVSYSVARLAAGAVLQVADVVLEGQARGGLAAVRPPGHHATQAAAMGFCLLNNVAIAARYAQRKHHIERVLIVDYDVHHGNGTQDIFYADPSVYYISTHQSPLYPGTGTASEIGEREGSGFTLNIPLPPGIGDQGYLSVFREVILPAARRFAPEVILVSAGFDAHWADPLANMRLSLNGYNQLARLLCELAQEVCGGRLIFVLEGGYNLRVLGHAWANVARALLGDPNVADPLGTTRERERSLDTLVAQLTQLHHLR